MCTAIALSDWIQIVASSLAILAGFGGIMFQHHLERKKARQDEIEALEQRRVQLKSLLASMLEIVTATRDELRQKAGFMVAGYYRECLEQTSARLLPYRDFTRRFDVTTIADGTLWSRWARVCQLIELIMTHLETERAWTLEVAHSGASGDERFGVVTQVLDIFAVAIEDILNPTKV